MSQALWCNKGMHSFSADDPDKQHFTQTRTVKVSTLDTSGRSMFAPRTEVTEELDICGPCWEKQNMFQPAGEIEEAERKSDKSEAEMWKAKYEAERAHTNTIRIEPERIPYE